MSLRETFEKQLSSKPIKPDLNRSGRGYTNKAVHHQWIGFQAGHAAGLKAAADHTDKYGDAELAAAIRAMKP